MQNDSTVRLKFWCIKLKSLFWQSTCQNPFIIENRTATEILITVLITFIYYFGYPRPAVWHHLFSSYDSLFINCFFRRKDIWRTMSIFWYSWGNIRFGKSWHVRTWRNLAPKRIRMIATEQIRFKWRTVWSFIIHIYENSHILFCLRMCLVSEV